MSILTKTKPFLTCLANVNKSSALFYHKNVRLFIFNTLYYIALYHLYI